MVSIYLLNSIGPGPSLLCSVEWGKNGLEYKGNSIQFQGSQIEAICSKSVLRIPGFHQIHTIAADNCILNILPLGLVNPALLFRRNVS